MEALAHMAELFSAGEARLTREQNVMLPWVFESDLPAVYEVAHALGLATPNIDLLTDLIACPGGDFCSLANARSLHIAEAMFCSVTRTWMRCWTLARIDLHMSGCINSCGHHHSGHIGILGVDKDGKEWYQVTLGGSDGTTLSGPATGGKVVGPAFICGRNSGRSGSPAAHLPRAAPARRIVYRCAAPHWPRSIQGRCQRGTPSARRSGGDLRWGMQE